MKRFLVFAFLLVVLCACLANGNLPIKVFAQEEFSVDAKSAILVDRITPSGQNHGGKTIVLGDYQVARRDHVYQFEIHCIGTLGYDYRIGSVAFHLVSGVGHQSATMTEFPAQGNGFLHNGASVSIYKNSHARPNR